MNTKFMTLLCALPMVLTLGTTDSFSSSIYTQPTEKISNQLSQALDKFDISKLKVIGVFEGDGKSQLAAITHMAKVFEEELAENEMSVDIKMANYFDGFIGMSSGSILAAALALGAKSDEVSKAIAPLESKLIIPSGAYSCLGCAKATTQIVSAYTTNTEYTSNAAEEKAKAQNQYDAFTSNPAFTTAVSNVTSGEKADLKTGLNILTLNTSDNYSDKVIAADAEKNAAAKKNMGKIIFDDILDAAKTATVAAIKYGGKQIDQSAAAKALDIMKKTEEVVNNVSNVVDKTLLKQSPVTWLTDDTPILIIDFNGDTGTGNALTTNFSFDNSEPNRVKVTYTTAVPANMYPTKKLSFDVVRPQIDSSVKNCMQSIRLDSAVSTNMLADFLTKIKLAKDNKEFNAHNTQPITVVVEDVK